LTTFLTGKIQDTKAIVDGRAMKSEARMTGQPLLNRCEKLNRFLKIPGAPLDNNVCERALKRGVFNRKNSTKQPGGGAS
jgi:hypothetical protein